DGTSCNPNPCGATLPAGGGVVCCLPDKGGDGKKECEDVSADACTSAGGTVSGASSCSPDPRNVTPPPPESNIACCVPGGTEGAECELLTTNDCTGRGGTAASAAACTPDPCGGGHGGGGSGGGSH